MIWPIVTLNDLQADEPRAITDGPFGSNLARQHYTESGPRVVRLQNIGDGRFIDAKAHISQRHFESLRAHEVLGGDLLVASLGEVLPRACLAPEGLGPAIVKADCIRVRLGPNVDPRWVMYALQRPSARKWADEHRHGVGRPRLGLKAIRQIPVPLPDLTEQRRIVEVLEDHLSRLDAAEHLIHTASLRLERLLLSTLTRSVTEMRQRGEPFVALGDLTETSLGKMLDAKKADGELTRYLANINVRWGSFALEHLKEVPLTVHERQRLKLQRGDILACEGGEPGRSAVWEIDDSDIAYQKALHRIRVLDPDALSPHFVALMLREAIQSRRWDSLFTGTTIKHLPQEKLRRIEIPVPPIAEQRALQAYVQEVDRQAAWQAEALTAAKRRSRALRRGVLVAALSGKLTGRTTDADFAEVESHELRNYEESHTAASEGGG